MTVHFGVQRFPPLCQTSKLPFHLLICQVEGEFFIFVWNARLRFRRRADSRMFQVFFLLMGRR